LARAKRVRWGGWKYALGLRVGWHARGARAKHELGTREARAFSGFNEHPLVIYIRSTDFAIELGEFLLKAFCSEHFISLNNCS
jgi:hypothetical protein